MRSTEQGLRPNIILITLESTRADHLPCYGYHRDTTPNICEVAEDGVLFENAYSQGSFTSVSMPSLLTSLSPNSFERVNWTHQLDFRPQTFMDVLRRHNYTTLGNIYGLPWERKLFQYRIPGNGKKVVKYIKSTGLPKKEFLLYVFFNDLAHGPWTPPEKYRKWDNISLSSNYLNSTTANQQHNNFSLRKLKNLYDEEILEGDHHVGKLIKYLKKRENYKNSMIIITSDHGEFSNTPSGYVSHGSKPFEGLIHVPLIIKFPGNKWAGNRVEESVRHIDIVPTVYDYMGLRKTPETFGSSLIPVIRGGKSHYPIFSAAYPVSFNNLSEEVWTLKEGKYKYFLYGVNSTCNKGNKPKREILYNLDDQGKRRKNIIDKRPQKVKELREELCKIYLKGLERKYEVKKVNLTGEMRKKLKKMGYLK